MVINSNLYELSDDNSFSMVSSKVRNYKNNNPTKNIISFGVGDVSLPVIEPVITAMHKAVDDLSKMDSFSGYGSYYGLESLRNKIALNDYKNLNISSDEIYVSNGTKTDCTSILELFDINSKICITDSMYPIYKNGSLCLNRNVTILKSSLEENFFSKIPSEKFDIIYLCSPSNPVGIAYSYEELKKWVDYALINNSVILYDNVYEPFIRSDKPHSIYEINGAKNVAIEFRSFSKSASFTGVRCSYYVIPNELYKDINVLWKKRTINRFNGCDYIAQKGAEATYLEESKELIKNNINYYLENGRLLRECFTKLGFTLYGGFDSPYLWVKCLDGYSSWKMFDIFLKELNIIIIPGIIFGEYGDGYFRVSSLGNRDDIKKGIERMCDYYEKD